MKKKRSCAWFLWLESLDITTFAVWTTLQGVGEGEEVPISIEEQES